MDAKQKLTEAMSDILESFDPKRQKLSPEFINNSSTLDTAESIIPIPTVKVTIRAKPLSPEINSKANYLLGLDMGAHIFTFRPEHVHQYIAGMAYTNLNAVMLNKFLHQLTLNWEKVNLGKPRFNPLIHDAADKGKDKYQDEKTEVTPEWVYNNFTYSGMNQTDVKTSRNSNTVGEFPLTVLKRGIDYTRNVWANNIKSGFHLWFMVKYVCVEGDTLYQPTLDSGTERFSAPASRCVVQIVPAFTATKNLPLKRKWVDNEYNYLLGETRETKYSVKFRDVQQTFFAWPIYVGFVFGNYVHTSKKIRKEAVTIANEYILQEKLLINMHMGYVQDYDDDPVFIPQ